MGNYFIVLRVEKFNIPGGFNNRAFSLGISGVDRLRYINLPILIKYYPKKWINFHGGPQVGYLIEAESENYRTGDIEKFTDDVEPVNISFCVGIELIPKNTHLGVRYIHGIYNLNNLPDTNAKITITNFQIYAGVPFEF